MTELTDAERRSLEDQLNKRLLAACDESEKAGFSPISFRESLAKDGPVVAVTRVIMSDPNTSGFTALIDAKSADLTGEAIALAGPWKALFDRNVLDQARKRLIDSNRPDLAKD